MSLQNTEELYSSAKWTPRVGEQYKKCASFPAWPDSVQCSGVLLSVIQPGQKQPRVGETQQDNIQHWHSERQGGWICLHKRKWSAMGKCLLSKIGVPAHTLARACGEGNAVAEMQNLQSRKFQLTTKWILWHQMAHVFCITVNISFNVCAQVAGIYIHWNHSLFQMQMPCACSIYRIQVTS